MNIKKFVIQICSIFLSITISNCISKIVANFSYFSLMVFILVFFLALNFFFAKFKQLNDSEETLTGFGFSINVMTLACFAFMPFFMTSFIGIMSTQIALRIFDLVLIFSSNHWKLSRIDKIERRWVIFDVLYFIIEILLISIYSIVKTTLTANILITVYLVMAVFEASFDLIINRHEYGLEAKKDERE